MLTKMSLIILVGYVFIAGALYLLQNKVLYHPTSPVDHLFHEINFVNEGESLNVIVSNPGASQAVIYFGGNAETVELSAQYLSRVLPHFTVYFLNYRGYGKSTGHPSEHAFYSDSVALYDFIEHAHDDIAVVGRSIGSSVATWLISQRKVSKAVLVTPFDSVLAVAKDTYWFLPVKWLLKDQHRSIERVRALQTPVTIIVAAKDEIINSDHAENIFQAMPKSMRSRVTIAGAGHNNLDEYKEYFLALAEALSQTQEKFESLD